MCKANGSHPTGSCLSQSLGAGEHSGAGGDDIVHQQDAFACDLLFIQNAVDTPCKLVRRSAALKVCWAAVAAVFSKSC